jgi:hypothetical protein
MSALAPPIRPMLARLARELPPGLVYEPKWDGFRCLAFRDGGQIELRSRNDRPLVPYFPELLAALRALPERRFVLNGEIVRRSPRSWVDSTPPRREVEAAADGQALALGPADVLARLERDGDVHAPVPEIEQRLPRL